MKNFILSHPYLVASALAVICSAGILLIVGYLP